MYVLNKIFLLVFYFLIISNFIKANDEQARVDIQREIRIVFYNVENLFDIYDDSLTLDDEFLPSSDKHWTLKKYRAKIRNIYKVIAAVGGYEPPEIIALCEIENRKVLNDLIRNTPLSKYPYQIVHKESPDPRGIDVAVLYRNDKLDLLAKEFIGIYGSKNNRFKTRDIVYVKVLSNKTDTLHVFANHWPSRRGGINKSEPKRILAASVLRNKTDSIFNINSNSRIIITGDFNDGPLNKSISEVLIENDATKKGSLINLSSSLLEECRCGTLKYKGNWDMFDQFIVSGSLLSDTGGLRISETGVQIFNVEFLLEDDEKYFGSKPFRTYDGYRYIEGYSDHLPVYLDLIKK